MLAARPDTAMPLRWRTNPFGAHAMTRMRSALALALLLAPAAACADSSDIEHHCTVKYPSMMQYFAWKDCVKTETKREAEEDFKRQQEDLKRSKEEAARPCIADDITRMEGLASKTKAAITSDLTLEEAKDALSSITGQPGQIQIASDSIRERVLVSSIETKCDADFHFLINVREGVGKKLRWLRVAAQNPPVGYQSGIHGEFGSDFDEERARVERRRFEEDYKANLAKQEREREEQRRMLLRNVKVSDIRMDCGPAGSSCAFRGIEFTLTNTSQQPVKDISFGWMFLTSQMTECPAAIATKQTLYMQVLQPGEKLRQKIYVTDAPESRDARFCIRVTDFGGTR
jgi:hypothetical protein